MGTANAYFQRDVADGPLRFKDLSPSPMVHDQAPIIYPPDPDDRLRITVSDNERVATVR